MSDQTSKIVERCIAEAMDASLSRRRFMECVLGSGLTASSAATLWSTRVMAATPVRGGTFRVGLDDAGTSDSLDPAITASMFAIHLSYASRSYLTEITSANTVGPDAAQSWEASADARTWRFTLFPGQEFHNGRPVTADDVVTSFNYHKAPESKSGGKGLLLDVDRISAEGRNTVVFSLKTGNADVPYIVSDYHFPILPADGKGGIDWASGVGAGPYKITEFRAGVSADLSRFNRYHRPDQAFFDSLKLTAIVDATARQTALLTGQVDAISAVPFNTVGYLGRNPKITIDEIPGGTFPGLPMNCTVAPFNNPDVRRALKYAIDREQIVKNVFGGHAVVANDQPISPVMAYYKPFTPPPYDPEKARFLLKKAGIDALSIPLSTSTAAFGAAIDMAVLFQSQAAKAGIDIEVVREAADGYWSSVWLKKPFVVVHDGQRPTPDLIFSLFFRDGAAWNDTQWHNDRFQRLLVEAKAVLDPQKRGTMYQEMADLLSDDGGIIIPAFENKIWARRSNVEHGPQVSGAWDLDGARAYQRWWFKSPN